ncbi:MAG: fumarylacetoacetate hydrolase family protein [Pseudomonadota bacterium]|jgi:2-keto-4-pentenoate hydratase|nr:fumarylacetoacetate hydrolase family protein [Pseudomonadota bacterium]
MTNPTEELAVRLRNAYRDGPIAPLRDALDPEDVDSAYKIQAQNTAFWEAGGRKIVGAKIGLTSRSVQEQLGVDQPDYGILFDDMQIPDGGTLAASSLMQGKVEAEVALVLKKDLDDPRAGPIQVLAATEFALPALEIVDSRIADWKITIADTIADNASSGFFVLGNEPVALTGLDLLTCGMVLEVNEKTVSTGVGANCLGHPLQAAAWLARTRAQNGAPLRAGDILLTGALGPMAPLFAGARVRARMGGLGTVSFSMAQNTGDETTGERE